MKTDASFYAAMMDYEKQHFHDLSLAFLRGETFQEWQFTSTSHKLSEPYTLNNSLADWQIFEDPDLSVRGECRNDEKVIVVRDFNLFSTVLHEMCHAYLHQLPQDLSQYLTIQLYRKVLRYVPELNTLLCMSCFWKIKIQWHDPLFWLKTFDLDKQTGLPWGTVAGYSRDGFFKMLEKIERQQVGTDSQGNSSEVGNQDNMKATCGNSA